MQRSCNGFTTSSKKFENKNFLFLFYAVDLCFRIYLRGRAEIQGNPTIFRSEDRKRELDLIKLRCLGPIGSMKV